MGLAEYKDGNIVTAPRSSTAPTTQLVGLRIAKLIKQNKNLYYYIIFPFLTWDMIPFLARGIPVEKKVIPQ